MNGNGDQPPGKTPDEFELLDRMIREAPAAEPEKKTVNAPLPAGPDGKQRMIGLALAMAGAIAFITVLVLKLAGGDAPRTEEKESGSADLLRDLRTVDQADIRGLRQRNRENAGSFAGEDRAEKAGATIRGEESERSAPPAPKRQTGDGRGKNFEKDRDIIEQYKTVNPAAAAGEPLAGETGGSNLRYQARPFAAGSNGNTAGGIRVMGRDTGPQKTGSIDLHNTQLKARLKFSIRSSASNSITAESTQDIEGIPAGSIFYGSGSFSNKRTYIQFSKVRIGGAEYDVKAYAISGKDPGIPSEVIEIENNAKITFSSGVTDATGKVIDNLVGAATGGIASGIVRDTTGDIKEKNEQERTRYEYRVGAGTSFTIYIE